jgi:iron complex outermembrane recepter protein
MRALRPIGGTRSLTLPGSPLLLGLLMWLAACLPIAHAQDLSPREQPYDIPAQGLAEALITYSDQSGVQVVTSGYDLVDRSTAGISGNYTAATALDALLAGSGMQYRIVGESTVALTDPNAPPITLAPAEGGASGEGSGGFGDGSASNVAEARRAGVEEIIVTGQKKEERLQDVPIAISAFSMEDLDAQKIEGGFDLLKAIPNVTFSKTNFTSYNFQIRGVGTQSISAASDPGVAVSFNNIAVIQNRLFEQEYLDIERVEVLRGPQGTLYGRNATAGVINVISHRPELETWAAEIDMEIGNYQAQRLRGLVNIPFGRSVAMRAAFAMTDREGYTYNAGTDHQVDGRDLWTGRLSLAWQPSDAFRADLIWERFEEDDNRLRTGKQLCHRDPGLQTVGQTQVHVPGSGGSARADEIAALLRPAVFSQGCKPGSLYTDGAFDTPNGLALPFVFGSIVLGTDNAGVIGLDADGNQVGLLQVKDPYGNKRQSRDLREIESILDPRYRAEADLLELNLSYDLSERWQLFSQSAYVEDSTYSFQDFNRFNTEPVFNDTTQLQYLSSPNYSGLAPGGVFCDPQIGCSDSIAGFDIAQAEAEQFTQEFRLQSSLDGPLNYSVGANYTRFEVLVDYYIFFNIISAQALLWPFNGPQGLADPGTCFTSGFLGDGPAVPTSDPTSVCPYVDPNPISSIDGNGHNYFRSKSPYELESTGYFGEVYWNVQEDLKLTAGLRYTRDKKTTTPAPSQLLTAPGLIAGGVTSFGYPTGSDIVQKWGEWTGRLVLDWKPQLEFTDETLLYASYSRGYKGGGANPPQPGFASREETMAQALELGVPQDVVDLYDGLGLFPILYLSAVEYEPTFEPEYVNAFEVGTKNTLFGGAMMLNMTAFYYDYADYQVSQIRDRTAVNENFDATMWGLELETLFVPHPDWQFLANVGYLKTRIASGETSLDIMDRTQGNDDYVLVKPWLQLPSNCVVPTTVAERWLQDDPRIWNYWNLCGVGGILSALYPPTVDPSTGQAYDVANYPELNGGAGLRADIGGNELPQSPRFTVTLGGQYSFDIGPEWRGTARVDYYWQDESYHRVYNTDPYDRLQDWSNTNVSLWVTNERQGVTIEAYVKNAFDETPITGAFLNSDDTGLTTNVFTLDPRLVGVSIKKVF